MSEFEKWYKEKYYKYDLYPKYAQFRKEMEEVWQAATSEANKRIEALEGEVANVTSELNAMNENYQGLLHKSNQQKAHINTLREALVESLEELEGCFNTLFEDEELKEIIHKIKQILASTPAQSLIQHDNEVIEKCAEVCDTYGHGWGVLADQIRTLKG